MKTSAKTSIVASLVLILMIAFAAPAMSAPAVDASIIMKAVQEDNSLLYDVAVIQEVTPAPPAGGTGDPADTVAVVEEWTEYGECINGTRTITHWSKHSDGSISSSLQFEPCALICVDGWDGDGNPCGFCYDPVLTSQAELDSLSSKHCPVNEPPVDNPPKEEPPAENPPLTEQPPDDNPPAEQPPADKVPDDNTGTDVHEYKLPNTGTTILATAGIALLLTAAAFVIRRITMKSSS